jgi:hypothetical protein
MALLFYLRTLMAEVTRVLGTSSLVFISIPTCPLLLPGGVTSDRESICCLVPLPPGLVSLIAPSLFTSESVTRITRQSNANRAITFTFGRHFAASIDREKVILAIASCDLPGFTADSEWEYREGILSRASIINHLSASANRLSPALAAGAYVALLILVSGGWRLNDKDWRVALDDKFMEADGEVMYAVG